MEDVFIDNQADDESLNAPNFFVFCLFVVKPNHVENFRHFISQFVIEARKHEGSLAYDVLSSCTDREASQHLTRESHSEFIIMEKWINKRSFDDTFCAPNSLNALNYIVQEQNLLSFPQVSMWQKINGIHHEFIDNSTGASNDKAQPAESNLEHNLSDSEKVADKNVYVMSRRRTVKSDVNPKVLLQIMCRLAQLATDSEYGCLGYDIYTSRSDEGRDDVLEVGTWINEEAYFKHLGAHYVQESEVIKTAFINNKKAKFWIRQPDGLLESNPRKMY